MVPENVIKKLSVKNDKKIILLVIDGLGGLEKDGLTELEKANIPNMDRFAKDSACGLLYPVDIGITPGSGPAHLSLFGYDPLKYDIGRGILEALGIDVEVGKNDISCRGNFVTLDSNGIITDRRAGRIPTEKNKELCKKLSDNIKEIDGVKVTIYPGKEHRLVVIFSKEGIGGNVTDTDPQKIGVKPLESKPLDKDSELLANVVNKFTQMVQDILKNEHPANGITLRGITPYPKIPSMTELFKLTPAAIATYPMYRGLAKLVGMELLETGQTIEDEIKTLKENYDKYDFFYIHIKKTDSYGEDGNFDSKVKILEEVDKYLPEIRNLMPDVFVITGDHSTPAVMKGHSFHPNPVAFYSLLMRKDMVDKFTEYACSQGTLGHMYSKDLMQLMLASSLKLKKYGA